MKKTSALICASLWLIFSGQAVSAQDFQTVRDGIEHAQTTRQLTSSDGKPENVVFNLLRLDLKKVRLDVVHAMDAAIGLEKTSSIAARHGAAAAINAGFFRIDRSIFEGDDVSNLQIDGKVLSESNGNRIALFINNLPEQTTVAISHLSLSGALAIDKKSYDRLGINRERRENDLVVYTPEFHRTTMTGANGLEIIVKKGAISEIFDNKGSTAIPADGFVISASGKKRAEILASAKIGAKAGFLFSRSDPGGLTAASENPAPPPITAAEDIVSGVPLLISNGKIQITWQEEKSSKAFVETHHPRTAVAKLTDGRFLLVTVDGRSVESGGISLPDLAAFLLEMRATDAMNLDGGGSTTMFLDGKIVNKPSDKEGERKVGDAILVFPRNKSQP